MLIFNWTQAPIDRISPPSPHHASYNRGKFRQRSWRGALYRHSHHEGIDDSPHWSCRHTHVSPTKTSDPCQHPSNICPWCLGAKNLTRSIPGTIMLSKLSLNCRNTSRRMDTSARQTQTTDLSSTLWEPSLVSTTTLGKILSASKISTCSWVRERPTETGRCSRIGSRSRSEWLTGFVKQRTIVMFWWST